MSRVFSRVRNTIPISPSLILPSCPLFRAFFLEFLFFIRYYTSWVNLSSRRNPLPVLPLPSMFLALLFTMAYALFYSSKNGSAPQPFCNHHLPHSLQKHRGCTGQYQRRHSGNTHNSLLLNILVRSFAVTTIESYSYKKPGEGG